MLMVESFRIEYYFSYDDQSSKERQDDEIGK